MNQKANLFKTNFLYGFFSCALSRSIYRKKSIHPFYIGLCETLQACTANSKKSSFKAMHFFCLTYENKNCSNSKSRSFSENKFMYILVHVYINILLSKVTRNYIFSSNVRFKLYIFIYYCIVKKFTDKLSEIFLALS